ncbi:MAG: hypothetical protein KF746_06565 [Chitinophagaceae bacterium]|nr:hypothetical protein [Chitinophagaceae bacterium]
MYYLIKNLHSLLAYVVLLALVIAVLYVLNAWLKNKKFDQTAKKIILSVLIACHLQFVIGLIAYFISPLGFANASKETMGNSVGRLYMLEHPLMMLLAIVFITIGYSKAKRIADDKKKFKTVTIFYTIGLIFILSRLPWQAWLGIGTAH